MANIVIVGAGIAGPTAALNLATIGHNVTVFERRPESDLHSESILGITQENYRALTFLGAKLESVQLPNQVTQFGTSVSSLSPFRYITWTDLHRAIVSAARKAGAEFRFGTEWNGQHGDVTVYAGGVGMAKKNGNHPSYAGYVVVRGFTPGNYSNYPWTSVSGDHNGTGKWMLNVGDTKEGASFALFAHRDNPPTKTEYCTLPPAETVEMPREFQRMIHRAKQFQIAPIADWDVPNGIASPDHREFFIGDANGAMRPHTSMGANLGITEALSVLQFMNGTLSDNYLNTKLMRERAIQRQRGIAMGTIALGRGQ